jgi:hypothetical protein
VNTKSQRSIMLANKAIRRVHDFIYLGSNVSEDGGTRKDVETRIQKVRGAFTKAIAKAVPLHAMKALGGRRGIAPTHSRPRL